MSEPTEISRENAGRAPGRAPGRADGPNRGPDRGPNREAWASARVEGELLIVSLGGPWVTKHIGGKQARLARIDPRGAQDRGKFE